VLLWLMILLTIFKFWQVSRNAALLLVPYILSVLIIAFLFSFLHPETILTIITDQNVLIMTRQY
jgi:tryptophan-rich sensory protein